MNRTFRRLLSVGFCLLALTSVVLTARSAASGLAWLEAQYSDPALEGAHDVALSPDMKFVYVAAFFDDAVAVFSRNLQTGALIFVEGIYDGDGSLGDMDGPNGLAVSPDGAHVYVVSYFDDAVVWFSRNATTGRLTYVDRVKMGDPGITTLDGAVSLAFSPDSSHLYVISNIDNSLTAFSRTPSTGALALVDTKTDDVSGTLGLRDVERVLVSADGKNVYVSSPATDNIAVFSRNPSTGVLTWMARVKDGEAPVDGLEGASGFALDPTGAYLYVAGSDENAIAIFTRNTSTGALTYLSMLQDGVGGLDWMDTPRVLAVSPAGDRLYLVSEDDNVLTIFSRNPATGLLTYLTHAPYIADWDAGLGSHESLALSADGLSLYVTSNNDESVALFQRDPAKGELIFSQQRKNLYYLGGPVGSAVSPDGERLYVAAADDQILQVFNRLPSGALTFADYQSDVNLSGLRDVAASPGGDFVYAAAHDDNSLLLYHWDDVSAYLDHLATYTDGSGTVDGLIGVQAITISPDGKHLYAASELDNCLAAYGRDLVTGSLTWVATYTDGVGGNDYLGGAYEVAVSPDGKHVYLAAYTDDAITVFSRNATTGALTRQYVYQDAGAAPQAGRRQFARRQPR